MILQQLTAKSVEVLFTRFKYGIQLLSMNFKSIVLPKKNIFIKDAKL